METLKQTHENASEFVDNIFSESTVQGLKFVGCRKLKTVERVYWFIAVTFCLMFSAYLIHDLYVKYVLVPVIISFTPKETSIQRVPFPAITICNVNIFKKSALKKLIKQFQFWVSQDISNPLTEGMVIGLSAALEQTAQFCMTTPSFRRSTDDIVCDVDGEIDIMESIQTGILNLSEAQDSKTMEQYEKHMTHIITTTFLAYLETSVNCEDMILKCAWSGKVVPCKEIFIPTDTRQGRCCAFNMMPKYLTQIKPDLIYSTLQRKDLPEHVMRDWANFTMEDLILNEGQFPGLAYPKHQIAGGMKNGLSIVINPQVEEYSTCTSDDGFGFKIHAHSPLSMSSVRRFGSAIPINSEVFVEVDPYLTDADVNEMKTLKIEHRECYIPTDKESHLNYSRFYTVENCFSECVSYHQAKNCSCIQHHFPNDNVSKVMPCRPKQSNCADGVLETLMKDEFICGNCRPPCTEVEYKMAVHHFRLQDEALNYPPSYTRPFSKKMLLANNYSVVHIYFATDSLYIKERKSLYSVFQLIGNAGCLLGFTLGISIVSFIELIYYATLRLYFHYKSVKSRSTSREQSQSTDLRRSRSNNSDDDRLFSVSKVRVKPRKNSNAIVYPYLR